MPDVPENHPLAGTWVTEEEDSDVAFVFTVNDGRFCVQGYRRSTGEAFEILNTTWDGEALTFTARFPSTGSMTRNAFRLRPDGRADLELTIFERWKKKDVNPGELPESWR